MDNLCHTLVGAALGQAGLKKLAPLGMPTLMIAANLPDLDVLAIPFGESLSFRRGWTHGPLAWVVLPLALTALVLAWDRLRRSTHPGGARRPGLNAAAILLLATVGVLSHPFFDWLNTYGIRLLMPFSETWFYGDALFIVDPWVWLALGAGVWRSRWLERREHARWAGPARASLVAVALYVGAMVTSSAAGEATATREIERRTGAEVRRLMAGPVPVNPFRRALVFEVDGSYGFGELVWTPRPELRLHPELRPTRAGHPAVAGARREEEMADFLYWARFPFFRVDERAEGAWVEAVDARYSGPMGSGWASARVWVPRSW